MTQNSIIEKIIEAHETILDFKTKAVLLELIGKRLVGGQEKYEKIAKNFKFTTLDSFIVRVLFTVQNDLNINNKKQILINNVNCLLDLLNKHCNTLTTLQINSETKLIGGRVVRVIHNVDNNNIQTKNDIKKIIDKLLLDVWYIIEYIGNNSIQIKIKSFDL